MLTRRLMAAKRPSQNVASNSTILKLPSIPPSFPVCVCILHLRCQILFGDFGPEPIESRNGWARHKVGLACLGPITKHAPYVFMDFLADCFIIFSFESYTAGEAVLPGHPCLNFFAESDTPHPCRIPTPVSDSKCYLPCPQKF